MSIFSESPQCSVCTLVSSDKIQVLTSDFLLELLAVAVSSSLNTHALQHTCFDF